MSNALDVKWPTPSLFLERQKFTTYPNEPISATLRYSEISCEPSEKVPAAAYTLQLIYCGSSTVACDPQNKSRVQVSEKIDTTNCNAHNISLFFHRSFIMTK